MQDRDWNVCNSKARVNIDILVLPVLGLKLPLKPGCELDTVDVQLLNNVKPAESCR